MLFMTRRRAHQPRITAPSSSTRRCEEVAAWLRKQGKPDYIESITEETFENAMEIGGYDSGSDGKEQQLYDQAVAIVARDRKCSTSYLQRKLSVGYNKAAKLVEQMEEQGVISQANHVGKREVLVPER
jgi:DNA segregation ATPase FtsK/SpoIIIE, S-DNA-T family